MRKTLAAAAAVFVCLFGAAPAFAFNDPGDGGGRCWVTVSGGIACSP